MLGRTKQSIDNGQTKIARKTSKDQTVGHANIA